MSVQKKSLINRRTAAGKAIVAKPEISKVSPTQIKSLKVTVAQVKPVRITAAQVKPARVAAMKVRAIE